MVDDGSGEEFADVFGRIAATDRAAVITHDVNRGKGRALKTGLSRISEFFPECRCVIFADADGQHPVADVLEIRDECLREDSFVLTTRIFGQMPLRSRIGNGFMRLAYALFNHKCYTDNQCGLRAFPTGMRELMLSVPGDRYEYEMAMLVRAEKTGVRIVPFYRKAVYIGDNESSHFRPVTDSMRVVGRMSLSVLPSLLGFLIRIVAVALVPFTGLMGFVALMLIGMLTGLLTVAAYSFSYRDPGYKDSKRELGWRIVTDAAALCLTFALSAGPEIGRMGAYLIALTLTYFVKYEVLKGMAVRGMDQAGGE